MKKASNVRRISAMKKIGLFGENRGGALISRATNLEDLTLAYELVYRTYYGCGYIPKNNLGIRIRSFEASPQMATFVAKCGLEVVGVTSIIPCTGLDLPIRKTFSNEFKFLRIVNRKICEGTNWAIAKTHRKSSVMSELIRCAFAHSSVSGYTDIMAEISPGHIGFYELLGFTAIGSTEINSNGVKDSLILVRLDLTGLERRWSEMGDDEGEKFIKNYYVDENPYFKNIEEWQKKSDLFFSDIDDIKELFIKRSRFLFQCSIKERKEIKKQWGEEIFNKVLENNSQGDNRC